MSKYELRSKVQSLCGISHEESLLASSSLSPPLLERIGGPDGMKALSTHFYDRVFDDKAYPWFLGIFATSTKREAIDNQYRFLVEMFGGPELYKEKKGRYTRLVGRHANYSIGIAAARRWMEHMKMAIEEHTNLRGDEHELAREYLIKYFTFTAYYIVVASEFMRDDQLSGGREVDSGRIW